MEESDGGQSGRAPQGNGRLRGLQGLAGGRSDCAAEKGWAFACPGSALAPPSGPGVAAVGGSQGPQACQAHGQLPPHQNEGIVG